MGRAAKLSIQRPNKKPYFFRGGQDGQDGQGGQWRFVGLLEQCVDERASYKRFASNECRLRSHRRVCRGAALPAFPRRAWEREKNFVPLCHFHCGTNWTKTSR